jgi:hypothetical protein
VAFRQSDAEWQRTGHDKDEDDRPIRMVMTGHDRAAVNRARNSTLLASRMQVVTAKTGHPEHQFKQIVA